MSHDSHDQNDDDSALRRPAPPPLRGGWLDLKAVPGSTVRDRLADLELAQDRAQGQQPKKTLDDPDLYQEYSEPVPIAPPRGAAAYKSTIRFLAQSASARSRSTGWTSETAKFSGTPIPAMAKAGMFWWGMTKHERRKKYATGALSLHNTRRCTAMIRDGNDPNIPRPGIRCRHIPVKGSDRCNLHYGHLRAPKSRAAGRAAARGEFRDWYQAIEPRNADGKLIMPAPEKRRWRARLARMIEERPDARALVEETFGPEWVECYYVSQTPEDNFHIKLDVIYAAAWYLDEGDPVPWWSEMLNWGKLPEDFDLKSEIARVNREIQERRRAAREAHKATMERVQRAKGADADPDYDPDWGWGWYDDDGDANGV